MTDWLDAALAYAGGWLEYQMQASALPGCVLAVAKGQDLLFERAYGVSDLFTSEVLTPRHRFRVASHSKTFTAVGIMTLQEAGRLHLDDAVSLYVPGLDEGVAATTIGQLLSHSAGLMRDGTYAPHWQVRDSFFDAQQLRAQLSEPLTLETNTRFKYSNLGYGLLGLVIEAITGEDYGEWIEREVVAAFGLAETTFDMPTDGSVPLSCGHSGKLPHGRGRIFGHQATHALASATGFVSTAADLARFFARLHPGADEAVLSPASRREMTRRHWHLPGESEKRHYGLGTICMDIDGQAVFGHAGAFPGFISRTSVIEKSGLSVSIVTNAIDGMANAWVEGVISIFGLFAEIGKPKASVADWDARFWTIWGACDLVPAGDKVLIADPSALRPFADRGEVTVADRLSGYISRSNGFGSYGEPVHRELSPTGVMTRLMLGGNELLPDAQNLAIDYEQSPAAD